MNRTLILGHIWDTFPRKRDGETTALRPVLRRLRQLSPNLRIDPETDARIRRAAATAGVSVSVFVASAAGAAADDVLADRREFVLEPERWEEFVRMLDRPACELPKLLDAGKRREQLLSE
jgi:uncharacterized protein (DUF1778 family)